MAYREKWHEAYWLLLVQLYLRKPRGVKPYHSKGLVDLALELHIHPSFLYKQLQRLAHPDKPRLQQLLDTYDDHPDKLSRAIKKLRAMTGFGNAEEFYKDVQAYRSWEQQWKPVTTQPGYDTITPAMLIMVLNLYFQLVPDTMVPDTPEITELARQLCLTPQTIAEIMEVYRSIDPALPQEGFMLHPLLQACLDVWKRWGKRGAEKTAAKARQIAEYFN